MNSKILARRTSEVSVLDVLVKTRSDHNVTPGNKWDQHEHLRLAMSRAEISLEHLGKDIRRLVPIREVDRAHPVGRGVIGEGKLPLRLKLDFRRRT